MRKYTLLVIAAVLIGFTTGHSTADPVELAPANRNVAIGRYVLLAATWEKGPIVLRIDTVTGDTVQLSTVGVAGAAGEVRGHVVGWTQVLNNPVEEAHRLSKQFGYTD